MGIRVCRVSFVDRRFSEYEHCRPLEQSAGEFYRAVAIGFLLRCRRVLLHPAAGFAIEADQSQIIARAQIHIR
jgi:hypothetical protein